MKNSITIFATGLLGGILLFLLSSIILEEEAHYQYIELKEDYTIEGVGILKKGTKVRVDKEMDEGFTRCILYLNHKYGETEPYQPKIKEENLIIPYWLNPKRNE